MATVTGMTAAKIIEITDDSVISASIDEATGILTLQTRGGQTIAVGNVELAHNHDDRYYTETEINTKFSDVDAKIALPRSAGYISATHNLNSGWTGIGGFTEDYDTASMFTPSTGVVVIPSAGVYAVSAGILYSASSAGRRVSVIEKGPVANLGSNPTIARAEGPPPDGTTSAYVGHSLYRELTLAQGDILRLATYTPNTSGLQGQGDFSPTYFSVRKIA